MSIKRRAVSKYGTELSFITAFITEITSADERISCITEDLTEQFSGENNTPSFSINIADICVLTFTRSSALLYTDYMYTVTDSNNIVVGQLYFCNSTVERGAFATRSWKYNAAANDGVINLSFCSFNQEINSPEIACTVIIDDNNGCYSIMSDKTAAIGGVFVDSGASALKKIDRLPYIYSTDSSSTVELIRNKVFVRNSSGERVFVTDSLYDISEVAVNSVLTIGLKNYFSLDEYTIMEV